jgi:hypothetical protein
MSILGYSPTILETYIPIYGMLVCIPTQERGNEVSHFKMMGFNIG